MRDRLRIGVGRIALGLGLLAAGGAPASLPADAAGPAAVGRAAPDFRLADLSGAPFTLERFRGHAVYINVFASWCPPCRREIPAIVAAHARYGPRVSFLGVDAQEPSAVARRFAEQLQMRYTIGIDRGQMAVTYGAAALPESVFIDRGGVVRAIVHGPVDRVTLERNLAAIATR